MKYKLEGAIIVMNGKFVQEADTEKLNSVVNDVPHCENEIR